MFNQIAEQFLKESASVANTLEFIKKAHGSQKYGNDPYWKHPLKVLETGRKFFGSRFTVSAQHAALLHDVPEDTPYGLDKLKEMGYSDEVLDAVALVTKDKSLSYESNIQRIISSGNKIAMMVKFADNYQNYTGDKSHWPAEKAAKSQAKYKKSMEALGSKLGVKVDEI